MEIRQILAYTENARQLLRETLDTYPEAWDRPFVTHAQYKTIAQLTAHMVGAEERWTEGRLYDNPPASRYEERAAKTRESVFADWDGLRARTLAFVTGADNAALARVIVTDLPQWGTHLELTTEEVLYHLANHQTWHLGQISMALQQQGIDPPNFDYVFRRSM